jgi:hypothetical protein
MNTPSALIALCACVMGLSACDKKPSDLPTPALSSPVPTTSGAAAGTSTDPSLPSAASVFPPETAAKADPALGETDGTRKPKKESDEALLPGQNNDHSAPLSPPK